MESRLRTLTKALSYRLVSTGVTTIVAWLATDQVPTAVAIAVGDGLLKVGLFYAHERVWSVRRSSQDGD